jgi:hypothetical protein
VSPHDIAAASTSTAESCRATPAGRPIAPVARESTWRIYHSTRRGLRAGDNKEVIPLGTAPFAASAPLAGAPGRHRFRLAQADDGAREHYESRCSLGARLFDEPVDLSYRVAQHPVAKFVRS